MIDKAGLGICGVNVPRVHLLNNQVYISLYNRMVQPL